MTSSSAPECIPHPPPIQYVPHDFIPASLLLLLYSLVYGCGLPPWYFGHGASLWLPRDLFTGLGVPRKAPPGSTDGHHCLTPPHPTGPGSLSHTHLAAGRIKRWVFMSGPESSLSSPLTIPMATSSSVAADGGCIPTISTYTQKVKEKELKSHGDVQGERSGSKDASHWRDLDTF